MGKHTKENSLIRYDNNIFSKVKRFFLKKFWRSKDKDYYYEPDNIDEVVLSQEEPTKKRSLYNFDAEDDENNTGDENASQSSVNIEGYENLVIKEGSEKSIYSAPIAQDVENMRNEEMEEQFIGMQKREPSVEEEKEELERKLMRYYESIKKIANLSL